MGLMKRTFRIVVPLFAVVLIASACGSSSDSDTSSTSGSDSEESSSTEGASASTAAPTTAAVTTAAPTTAAPTTAAPTTAAPTTQPPRRGVIEESFVGTATTPYSAESIVEGEIRVYFNNGSNGFLIAIYHGDGVLDPTDLCPGNSINTGTFENISNAPATAGACDGIDTDRGSVRICSSGVWLYETKIPNDSDGTLWGSVDKVVGGQIMGVTGQAANRAGTPEIDYSADVYDISAMFTSDGATEITCGEPQV